MQPLHKQSFPFHCAFEVWVAAFFVFEFGGVDAAAAAGLGEGVEHVVEHFVVDDEFHEELGDVGAVEGGVDADEGVAFFVAAENDVTAAAFARFAGAAAPGDVDLDLPVKTFAVDFFGEFVQVIDGAASAKLEALLAGGLVLAGGIFGFEGVGVGVHVFAEQGLAGGCGALDVLCEGFDDVVGGVEEHFVDGEARG